MTIRSLAVICLLAMFSSWRASAQVLISEIMYHPVEEPAFNADGSPVLDLYEDVHEFVELHNVGNTPVDLSGWRLAGGIAYTFPTNTPCAPGQFLVVAKNPARLANVPTYQLAGVNLLGPYAGQLGNNKDTIRLRNSSDEAVDAVSYSAEFPWAIGADALGADEEWTGQRVVDYQYRGRSLERVSFTHSANDPANWLASPTGGNPTPGRANSVSRDVPRPVVITLTATQASDEAALIRNNQPTRIRCDFSSAEGVAAARIEWFIDNIDATGESVQSITLTDDGPVGSGRFSALLPGQPDRTLVRYRIRANRGAGDEVISPRADDPYAWHAYFVTPVRASSRPVYDCLISAASLQTLRVNISQDPRRVTRPDPPGSPRVAWNATEPAVMVHNGVVYDIRMRHHGSRYNRNAGRNSFKWQFPRYRKFNGLTSIFETDKGDDFINGHGLFREVGLPVSAVQYVDVYLNNGSVMRRLEQGEFDGAMLDEYHRQQQALSPGSDLEPSGEIYKVVGTIDFPGEGPYGRGDGRRLSKPPYWTDLQMYDWTYALQNHGWRGSYSWKQMIDAFWVARGDSPAQPNPNIPALRSFFLEHFDIETTLTYIALENWCCPWDDTTQNHFFWQRRNGKWTMLPWDCDAWFGRGDNTPATSSLFIGEVGDPNNNFRGPNFFKDAFIKAFRQELKERFFLLNNTFLHPDNLAALGFGSIRTFAQQRMVSVNQQCGLGVFQRPTQPTGLAPNSGVTALPPTQLSANPYTHTATPPSPHAKTIWEIRSANGSYSSPVWKLSSATNLTSVPIPFEALEFGGTYFWRCTFEDAAGHPSIPSAEVSFNFGPSSAVATLVTIDTANLWRYDESGTDRAGTPWTALNFDDSSWSSGAALLAQETAALPEAIRTTLTLGRTTYYFRNRFNFPGSPQGASVRLRYAIDDGAVIYINGTELLRERMPGGPVSYATFASENVGDATMEGPVDVPVSLLRSGGNIIAVEVHQSNANSSDIVFGVTLEATLPAGGGSVVLNEIAASNTGSVTESESTPDWIELFNAGTQTVDLGGYALSDDVLRPNRFVLPSGTQIAARGYLTVWCDSNTNAPGLHAGFGLSDRGQTVTLFKPEGGALQVADYITFGLQIPDLTIGRIDGGAGDWQLCEPTPGLANRGQALGSASLVKINEWMASPASGDDWFELFNPADLPVSLGGLYLTDDPNAPTNTCIAHFSYLGPRGFAKIVADEKTENGANHAGFRLSASGDIIALYATNAVALIDSIRFGPQSPGVSEGRLPDGASSWAVFPTTASPGEANHLAAPDRWELAISRNTAGQMTLQASGTGVGQIVLQGSSDLENWTALTTRPGSDGSFSYVDPDAQSVSSRYYRIAVGP